MFIGIGQILAQSKFCNWHCSKSCVCIGCCLCLDKRNYHYLKGFVWFYCRIIVNLSKINFFLMVGQLIAILKFQAHETWKMKHALSSIFRYYFGTKKWLSGIRKGDLRPIVKTAIFSFDITHLIVLTLTKTICIFWLVDSDCVKF